MTSVLDALGPTESAIVESVGRHAGEWFPHRTGPTRVRLRKLSARPRSVTYAVALDEDDDRPYILAKMRRGQVAPAADTGRAARPRLAPSLLSNADLTVREYDGLAAIHATFAALPGFSAVRPLEHLPQHDTILMDYLEGRTLRRILGGRHRFSAHRLSGRSDLDLTPWRRAGTWLRHFQQSMPKDAVPARQSTRDEVVERLLAYQDYLGRYLRPSSFPDLGHRAAALASEVLPNRLETAVGHGDFAPRNALLLPDGRLGVFDPMPRWLVPTYEDLSRFVVGLHLVGPQVLTRGAAYDRHHLDRLEREVVVGYFGSEDVPHAQLRCFQLLVLLDTWAEFVSAPRTSMRARIRGGAVDLAAGHLRDTAVRMLRLADAGR